MIQLPVWAAVLVVFLFFPVGLGAYSFGWWIRGRYAPVRYVDRKVTPEMTVAQKAAFDRAFRNMDETFDELKRVFK